MGAAPAAIGTGSAMPLSLTGGSSRSAIWRSTARRVAGETITAPSSAADISRAERLTCWPITVYSWRLGRADLAGEDHAGVDADALLEELRIDR